MGKLIIVTGFSDFRQLKNTGLVPPGGLRLFLAYCYQLNCMLMHLINFCRTDQSHVASQLGTYLHGDSVSYSPV
jgi:hypothetical protein